MKIADLSADSRNPRSIDAASASGLRYSLREFGDISGIVFNRKLGRLVCGHQRLEQLRAEHGDALKINKPRNGAAAGRIKCPNGDVFGVRFVDWDEPKSWAANIAANNPAIAGTFTDDLQGQLTDLEKLNPEDFRELRLDELQDPGLQDDEWKGMPEFEHEDQTAFQSIVIHLKDQETVDKFAELIGQEITSKVKSTWFPKAEIGHYFDKEFVDES